MNFICFDTEDDSKELLAAGKSGFDKKVTQIAAISDDGKEYYSKGNVRDFLQWLRKQPERYIYCHNLQYDIGNLFSEKLDDLDIILVGGRMIRAVWHEKIFLDTFNIWPMSAKLLGKAFGLEKLETESMSTDKKYVFRDVEIIRAAMLHAWQICQAIGLTICPATLGTLAVKIWRFWGGQNVHDSSDLSDGSKFGGRVELFKVHNDSCNVCYTDINSLYPSVMLNDFPDMLESCLDLKQFGCAKVTIQLPETDLALLPVKNMEGRIFYPWGKVKGCWTIAEIRHAEQHGAKLLKVHAVMGTDIAIRPYTEYVSRLYQMRLKASTDADKLFFKLLLNNLYGKLGMSGKITRSVYQTPQNKNKGMPYGEKVLCDYQMPLADEVNWSHAAYVTAYGRIRLFHYLKLIGTDKLIYCDTDSAIFDSPDKSIPFPVSKELGEMKLEGWHSHAVVYAPKTYKLGSDYKAKGVPKAKARQFIETGSAVYDMPFRIREAIRFFDCGNSKQLSVWRGISKKMAREYDRKKMKKNRFLPLQWKGL